MLLKWPREGFQEYFYTFFFKKNFLRKHTERILTISPRTLPVAHYMIILVRTLKLRGILKQGWPLRYKEAKLKANSAIVIRTQIKEQAKMKASEKKSRNDNWKKSGKRQLSSSWVSHPLLGPSEGIPQEADDKLVLKFNQREKQSLV